MTPWRMWDRHPCTRPDLFWCYPLCGAGFFDIAFVLFLCSICFLIPTGLSLLRVVSPFMPSVILLLICSFLVLPPLLLMFHGAGGTRGEGYPFIRPDLFRRYPLCGAGFFYVAPILFLCSMGRFPSISVRLPPSPYLPSCCRHILFRIANLTFFMLLLSLLCSMGQGMGKGRAWG